MGRVGGCISPETWIDPLYLLCNVSHTPLYGEFCCTPTSQFGHPCLMAYISTSPFALCPSFPHDNLNPVSFITVKDTVPSSRLSLYTIHTGWVHEIIWSMVPTAWYSLTNSSSCCTLLHCSQIIVNTNPALLSCPHVVHSFTVPRLLSTPTLHYFPALMLYTPSLFPVYCQHQPCITFLPSCCTLLHCSQINVSTNPALLSCPHVVHSFTVPSLLSTPTLHYFPALMLHTPSLFPD